MTEDRWGKVREVTLDRSGAEEGGPRGGARSASPVPEGLGRYAAAFLSTSHERVRFHWRSAAGDWFLAAFDRVPGAVQAADEVRVTWRTVQLPHGLTAREMDVLTLVCLGLTNQAIAGRLGTSARTVSTQVERLLTKLGQNGRAGLAALTVEAGLMRLPVPGGLGQETGLALVDVERAAGAPTALGARPRPQRIRRAPLHIGSVLPLSGAAWADGLEAHRGAELAVKQINARGGIDGRLVEHVVASADFFQPGEVVDAFRSLVDLEVDAIITSYANSECTEVFDVVADYGQPFLHNATFERQVEMVREDPQRFGMIFQTCPSEIHYGVGAVRAVDELRASGMWRPRSRRIVSLELDLDSSRIANEQFYAAASATGWEVASVIRVPFADPDWPQLVRLVTEHDPAVVLVTHFVPQAMADFQRVFHQVGHDALVYGVYGPSIPHFAHEARGAAEGMLWSTVTGTYDDDFGRAFRRDFERLHGTPAGWSQAGGAYDQVRLLSAAWASAGTVATPAVAAFLRSTVYRGVNGVYFMGRSGQTTLSYPDVTLDPSLGQAHMVFQVQGRSSTLLGPSPYRRYPLVPHAAGRPPFGVTVPRSGPLVVLGHPGRQTASGGGQKRDDSSRHEYHDE